MMRPLLLLLAATLPMASAYAAPARKGAKSVTQKALTPTERLVIGISSNVYRQGENLIEACKRVQPDLLFSGLEPNADFLNSRKGEFETTESFNSRKTEVDSVLRSMGEIIACQSLMDPMLDFSYDADAQNFTGMEIGFRKFSHRVVEKKLAPFRATTRMGVPFTVNPWILIKWDFSIDAEFDDKCFSGSIIKKFQFNSPIEVAKSIKEEGKIVFFGNLIPPFYESIDENEIPSLLEPDATSKSTMTVFMKATRVMIIDKSGRTLWSCEERNSAINKIKYPTDDNESADDRVLGQWFD